jgi:hypothetical protein
VIGSEGSPLLVMMESEEQAALDVARIRYGGTAQAYGLESEANLQRFYGRQAKRQAVFGATGTLLHGVGTLGAIYAKAPKSPVDTSGLNTTNYFGSSPYTYGT